MATVKRAYRFRAYPSREQRITLNRQMYLAKQLYNLLLEQSQKHFEDTGKTFTEYDMNGWITKLKRKNPEFKELSSCAAQNVSRRLTRGYKNFFSRLRARKQGKKVKAGFPRFKSCVSSLTYPQRDGSKIERKRIYLPKIGMVNFVNHRKIDGVIKALTIKQNRSQEWHITIAVEKEGAYSVSNNGPVVGMDLGLKEYATLSDGARIQNPRISNNSISKVKKVQRRLSGKMLGSRNRRKARIKLARLSEHIERQRDDYLHKVSHHIVNSYSFIAYEELKIANMVKNHNLARQITDVSWGKFTQYLCYKAESAGCRVAGVDPRNTSKTCSGCGNVQDISLSERTFNCERCGMSTGRDLNASINILKRATEGQSGSNASGDVVRPQLQEAVVGESGTIFGGLR